MAIDEAISRQVNLVIDNTNPMVDDRAKYIFRAKVAGYKVVGYFMQSKLQDCIARNELREGKAKIPRTAIANTSNKLEMPSYTEGFDELYFVSIVDDAINIDEWRDSE
jgi:predicted kinase